MLRCRGCGLSDVNKTLFEELPDLEVLDLADNKLRAITADEMTPLRQLRELYLDGNHLTHVYSGVFRHNPQMQTINLARNEIVKVKAKMVATLRSLLARSHPPRGKVALVLTSSPSPN